MTALIILNYNNAADTIECLKSVVRHNTAPVRIIVVDNASTSAQRQALQQGISEIPIPVELVQAETNEGYARGNNLGLQRAYQMDDVDRVMVLNNDIIFVEDIIPSLIERQDSTPDCAIISPILYKKGLSGLDLNCARRNETIADMVRRNFLHYWWRLRGKSAMDVMKHRYYLLEDGARDQQMLPIELPSGSCMLMRKDVFKSIGSFDPRTFLYYEENILFKKIEKTGMRNYLCPDLKCIHLGAATTSAMPKSHVIMRAQLDSQRYYVDNYSGASLPWRLLQRLSSAFAWLAFRVQKKLSAKN